MYTPWLMGNIFPSSGAIPAPKKTEGIPSMSSVRSIFILLTSLTVAIVIHLKIDSSYSISI